VTRAAAAEPRRPRRKASVFVVRLRGRPGADSVRELRAILKVLLRRYQLKCVDAREEGAA
jgi:hypothetical protein